jgi:CheY-like chemotaxis protein
MPRWNKGSDVIERLLDARHIERVPADADTVAALLATAGRHVTSAESTADADPEGAFTLAYDAARKTATALLAHQGLRPTSSGGHIVIVDAMNAQFPGVDGLKSIDRLRRRRNQAEYPDPQNYDPVTTDEVHDALAAARRSLDAAAKLIGVPQLGIF